MAHGPGQGAQRADVQGAVWCTQGTAELLLWLFGDVC